MRKTTKPTLAILAFIPLAVLLLAWNSSAATNYLQWLGQYGLPADGTGLGAFTAAPATDSIPNLIKFSLGLNPWQAGYAGRYGAGITNNAGQDSLALTYIRPYPAPVGITNAGEFSSNILTWPGAAGTQIGNVTNGALQTITIGDTVPVAGASARFTRLKVTVTAIVPTNTVPPGVANATGVITNGQPLTVTNGVWDGGSDSPPFFSYQWTRNGANISDATNATYLYNSATDAGSAISVMVRAANIAGSTTVRVTATQVEKVVTATVATSSDDAEVGTGYVEPLGGKLYWPYSSNARLVFLRWQSQIPVGATITAAYLKVRADGTVGNTDKSVAQMQVLDFANCPTFTSSSVSITTPVMSSNVKWTNNVSLSAPTGWADGSWYASPNIATIVQDFVSRADYNFGNYIGIRGSWVAGTWKGINTWDYGDHSGAPQLEVHYTGGQTMLSLWMADPEVRLGQKVYCQVANTYPTDTLRVKLDGNVIYTKAAPLSSTQEVFTVDYRTLGIGSHTLLVELLQSGGSLRTSASRAWTKLHSGIAKCAIDENNAICLNGTPFFPITPWGLDASQFPAWGPYVNVQCGETFSTGRNLANWIDYLNQSGASNQLVMGPLTGGTFYPAGYDARQPEVVVNGTSTYGTFVMLDTNRLAAYIAATKDYPSLFTWGWQDEPDLGGGAAAMKATEVRRWTDLGHAMDTQHPHYCSFVGYPFGNGTSPYNTMQQQSYCFLYDDQYSAFWTANSVLPKNSILIYNSGSGNYAPYIFDTNANLVLYTNQSVPMVTNLPFAQKTPICDILGFDYYPYMVHGYTGYEGSGLADLTSALDNCRNWNYNLLPTMTWIETCSIGQGWTNAAPTAVQLKNLIWLSVIHGVKGLQWFHYFTATPAANYAEMNKALKMITALTQPILSAPENVTNVISGQGPTGGRVDLMSRQLNSQLYIFATTIPTNGIATNGMGTSVTITMSGLAAGQQIGVLGEARTITSAPGSFTDTFSPEAVHIYTYPALTNIPPVANAGGDRRVAVAATNGSASLILTGTNSFDADGTIVSYVWKDGATQIGSSATVTVSLSAGTHAISLVVTDNSGATGTNTVNVYMTPPPVATAGPDQQVTDTNNVGSVTVTLDGSGSYATLSTIKSYVWTLGGNVLTNGMTPQVTLLPGTNDITLTVTDNYGATGSDVVRVVVINTNIVNVQYQIAASGDDTWCMSGAGNSVYTSTTMYFPYTDTSRLVFLRWPVNIPAGKTILSADLQVKSDGNAGDSNPSAVRLEVVDNNNCPAFTANPFSYAVMATNVNWTLPATWTAGLWFMSGNIKGLVQTFINRPGYVSGNYLALRCSNVSGLWKEAYQWDNGTHTDGAILRVTYK